jgi:tripeptidyl-peptidase-1
MKLLSALLVLAAVAATPLLVSAALYPIEQPSPTRRFYTIEKQLLTEAEQQQHVITFRVALQQRNLDRLATLSAAVSDPAHRDYQDYMTREQVEALVAPPAARVAAVRRWLEGNGGTIVDKADGFVPAGYVEVAMTAAQIRRTFNVSVVLARHKVLGLQAKFDGSASAYFVPDELTDVVLYVQELPFWRRDVWRVGGPLPKQQQKKKAAVLSGPHGSQEVVVSHTLRNLYGLPYYNFTQGHRSAVGVLEFDGQFSQGDVTTYLQGNAEAGPAFIQTYSSGGGRIKTASGSVKSDGLPRLGDGECQLDVEMQAGLCTSAQLWFVTTNGFFDAMFQDLAAMPTPPLYSSISYNSPEGSQSEPQCEVELQKLALRGIAVLGASGDSGACDSNGNLQSNYPPCGAHITAVSASMVTSDGKQTTWNPPSFEPPYCASGNVLNGGCLSGGTEAPAEVNSGGYCTGSGVSTKNPVPVWQQRAVEAYMTNTSITKPSGGFNPKNRAYSDVIVNGNNIIIYYQSQWQMSGGTSAAAPIMAALLGVLNDVLATHGKRPLGFVNPALYSFLAPAFSQIGSTQSSNGCGQCSGWVGSSGGWNPLSGVGKPHMQRAIAIIESRLSMFRDL